MSQDTPDNPPDESRMHESPSPNDTRPPLLDAMPTAWRAVYDRIREAQATALMHTMDHPGDAEARAVYVASSAAVRAFRHAYECSSVQSIVRQIGEISGGES